MSEPSVLSTLTLSVLDAAEQVGFERAVLMAEARLDPAWFCDPDARIPLPVHLRLWAEVSKRPVGLALGAKLGLSGLGVVGYALSHTETVGAALTFLDRQRALIHSDAVPRMLHRNVEGEARFAYVQLVPAPFAKLQEPVDAQASAVVALLRVLAGEDVHPVVVRLQRPRPTPEAETLHARYYRCPVVWNAPQLEVEFRAEILTRRLPRADARLFGYLAHRADALRRVLPMEQSVSARAARELGLSLAHGEPSLAWVAKRLGMSERTLHRRLSEENTGFQALLKRVRNERALVLLEDPQLSASEVAGLLGYADPSTFFRAFKSWTGETPQAFRKRMLAPGGV